MKKWVAHTNVEGDFMFTAADSKEKALQNLNDALNMRTVLVYPINNPITTRLVEVEAS